MPVSSSTEHWIKPDALTINLNHFGDPDYLQVSVLAGAVVMAFKQDVIGYNAAHNYRTWPIEAANTYLETSSAYNVYARLTRSEVNARALIVYDTILRDIEGREITYAEDGSEVLGDSSVDYFFVFLGQVSPNIDSDGQMIQREWIVGPSFGSLDTNQQKNDTVGLFDLMFRPHYENPLDPNEITWIEALTHLGVAGGITMYANGGKLNIPSIYDGLPIDWNTLIRDENGVLKLNPDIELGSGISSWDELQGKPSWITNSKPKYTYSEIEGTPDLTKYALVSQIPSLSGYATESWVKNQGYLTQHQDLSGYQTKITSSNKLAYSLISGTPTSLKNPNALSFGSKSYDGSAKITLTADDLGALTSHQTIYTLTFASGTFASGTFTANSAKKTINIPTTTSHISEGSNLYFTNARAVSALTETLKAYVTLGGNQTITGEKNFTGGLKVNGSPIYYDTDKKYWKLEGDLLVTGGVTMYGSDSSFTPSTIMDAIAVDGTTISKSGGVLKVIGGTGGGVADSVAWANITGKPSWIGSSKPKYTYSEIEGTPDLTKYALVSQIPSLSGYATESWVKNQGYLTQHQDLSGYQTKITSSNKLAYSLISGTPTSLKNPNALSFGSKSYDGSAKITLTADDLGALTSHQTIYTLTFASGTFASGTFTANSAKKTINIPTTTSHISEGSNLYFTNARAVSALTETLKAYVTLGGNQTITGEKNFTGGLKVNGSPIYYDTDKKYWKLEGDLLVTGGVTMYGSDSSFTPSTIMDAIAVDGTTISKSGGVLKVIGGTGGGVADSVAWANITGKPSWIGSSKPSYSCSEITGAISTTELQNYLTSNSYLNVTSGDNRYLKLSGGTLTGKTSISARLSLTNGAYLEFVDKNESIRLFGVYPNKNDLSYYDGAWNKVWHEGNFNPSNYLPLSGGTISGTYGALTIHRTNEKSSLIKYSNSSGDLGHLGFNASKEPFVYKGTDTTTQYKIWHSGNDGGGSGLDADLLDGVQLSELFTSLSSGMTNKLAITIGGVTKTLTTLYASYASNFTVVWDNPSSGTYDLNGFYGGYVRHYGSGGSLSNAPSNFGNGAVLALTNGAKGLSGQLAWNIVHNSTTNVTNKLWWRVADSTNGFTYSQWKQIAFTDSNVASATKLETARTIWGQSFDGSGNVSGNMTGVGTISMSSALTLNGTSSTTARIIMSRSSSNYINYPADGKLCFGTSNSTTSTQAIIDGSNGNVGIGTTAPKYRLHIEQNTDSSWASVFQTPNSKVYLAQSSGRGIYAGVLSGVSTSYLLNLQYNQTTLGSGGSSALYVRTDGNVGIGTDAPDYKFHVVGTSHINGEASFNSSVTLKGTGSTTARIIMSRSSYNYINYPVDGSLCLGTSNASASTQLLIDGATGNVGIGTVEPSVKLSVKGSSHIKGTIYVTNADATTTVEDSGKIKFNSLNTRDDFRSPYIQAIHQGNYSRKRLSIFQSNATNYTDDFVEVFTILPNGNVGIGTASPSAKLYVSGDILATGAMTFYSMRKLKNVVDERGLSLSELSTIKPTRYTWKDGRDNRLHFGGIADDIQQVLPEVVYKTSDGILTMDYGNAAFAVASSLIEPVVDHEKRIAMLEEEYKQLRLKIELLKSA